MGELDCFASLAMTNSRSLRASAPPHEILLRRMAASDPKRFGGRLIGLVRPTVSTTSRGSVSLSRKRERGGGEGSRVKKKNIAQTNNYEGDYIRV
jgi:hypothetical protein